jgi:hypothetical protein
MMHGYNAVVLRRISIPGRAVAKIRTEKPRDFPNCIADSVRLDDIPDHHVAIGMKSQPVFVFDPMIKLNVHRLFMVSPEG